jgi:hypothetical protein
MPIHINFIDKIPFNLFENYQNLIKGYLIICDNFYLTSFNKIKFIKNLINDKLDNKKPIIKFGKGHPSKNENKK